MTPASITYQERTAAERRSRNRRKMLTAVDIATAQKLLNDGYDPCDIATRFNVTETRIRKVTS